MANQFKAYANIIDDMKTVPVDDTDDSHCHHINRYIDISKAIDICVDCGDCESKTIYITEYKTYRWVKTTYQPYKRLSHFIKNLTSIRRKKNIILPNTIIHFIKRRLKIISPTNIRNLLKTSKLKRYIVGVNQIYETITKKDIPIISINQMNEIIRLFKLIDNIYNDIPKTRVQFFNYHFIIRKLLKHIGRFDCIPFYKALKNINRFNYQNTLYKKITTMLFEKFVIK